MAKITKRIFKVWCKSKKMYVPLGYNRKATWSIWPIHEETIMYNPELENSDDYEVHEFETVMSKTYNLKRKEIKQ